MRTPIITTIILVGGVFGLPAQSIPSAGLPGGESRYEGQVASSGVPGFGAAPGAMPASTRTGSIVSFGTLEPTQIEELFEDLNVLSLLLQRNLSSRDALDYKMGIPLLLQSGQSVVQGTYLEGFGILCHLRVQFPLIPPAESETNTAPVEADSDWDQARRALYGQGEERPEAVRWNTATGEQSFPYNPNLVQSLKQRAIETLANAANIRHLPPDEWIALVVNGSANVPPVVIPNYSGGEGLTHYPGGDPAIPRRRIMLPPAAISHGRPTVLTLRVRKSAADDLAAKKITSDEFAARVQVHSYYQAGGQASAGRLLRRPLY